MNRLWVRLSLAFTGVMIAVMVIMGIAASLFYASINSTDEEVPAEVRAYFAKMEQESPRQGGPIPFLAIVGTVAITAGVLMSKSLTAPLAELEEAAQAIGMQNLDQRVTVRGSTEIQLVATRFNEMAGHLEQAEMLRRNLLTDVAHELRHPIHILRGNLRAILDDVYPLSKEEIARLVEQTNHLSTMINDLHELAQAEAQQLTMDKQPIDIARLVKDVTAVFKPGAAAKQIDLHMALLGAMPMLNVDASRMRQVLHNLLDNALRHTPENGRVHITVEQTEAGLQIKIADSGAGIKSEDLPHVFDRFYRADSARSREQGSAGLGLAIVRAIVEAHNGRVSVASPGPGLGSVFTLILPSI